MQGAVQHATKLSMVMDEPSMRMHLLGVKASAARWAIHAKKDTVSQFKLLHKWNFETPKAPLLRAKQTCKYECPTAQLDIFQNICSAVARTKAKFVTCHRHTVFGCHGQCKYNPTLGLEIRVEKEEGSGHVLLCVYNPQNDYSTKLL